eukprot:2462177-Ditylum_brightwellii.AAC.1
MAVRSDFVLYFTQGNLLERKRKFTVGHSTMHTSITCFIYPKNFEDIALRYAKGIVAVDSYPPTADQADQQPNQLIRRYLTVNSCGLHLLCQDHGLQNVSNGSLHD